MCGILMLINLLSMIGYLWVLLLRVLLLWVLLLWVLLWWVLLPRIITARILRMVVATHPSYKSAIRISGQILEKNWCDIENQNRWSRISCFFCY
jgi:hypothetical protein